MLVLPACLALLLCVLVCLAARQTFLSFLGHSPLAQIPGPPLTSFVKGHMDQLFNRKRGARFHLDLIEKYDRVAKVNGFFGDEQLYISDPLALQSVIVKEQDNFEETEVFIENNKIIFGEGLVATIGEHHKKQRRLVSPVFSVHRLRGLVPAFYDVAHRLRKAISSVIVRETDPLLASQPEAVHSDVGSIDMAEWLSRAALESIGQAGLGYSFDPLASPSNNPYTRTVRALIPTMFRIAPLRLLTPFITRLGPASLRRFLLNFVPIQAVQLLKRMSDQMDHTCREILREKRAARASASGSAASADADGKDIMSILLRANEAADEKERLSEAELLGQMNVLVFGAQDTTASALSRVLYLLSRPEHAALQARLRDEILRAREDGTSGGRDLDYDDLAALPLLDAILRETLRLYPPVPFVRRVARQTASLPLSRPIVLKDGRTAARSLAVPAGTTIWVSITGANRSTDIWGADAGAWKPERWLRDADEGKTKLPGVYSGMLTFLGGGRSCIGYRFALLEMKIILATLLASFCFTNTEDQIVWNLSQILSPSVIDKDDVEKQGMPIAVALNES